MHVPDNLSQHLTELSDATEEPGADLQAMLEVLIDDLRAAVPSFLGLLMTIPAPGTSETTCREAPEGAVTLNLLSPDVVSAVVTTLRLPLDALGMSGDGGEVIFYAAFPGAFVDLAADIRFACGKAGRVVLDGHLPEPAAPGTSSGISGLPAASVINQALGVLMDQGHTPDGACRVLRDRADRAGLSLHQAARLVLSITRAERRWA